MGDFNFLLSLSLSLSLSETLIWTLKSGLRPKFNLEVKLNFGLSLSLSEITLLFDLSLDLDRTLAQQKAKSKVKVTLCNVLDPFFMVVWYVIVSSWIYIMPVSGKMAYTIHIFECIWQNEICQR